LLRDEAAHELLDDLVARERALRVDLGDSALRRAFDHDALESVVGVEGAVLVLVVLDGDDLACFIGSEPARRMVASHVGADLLRRVNVCLAERQRDLLALASEAGGFLGQYEFELFHLLDPWFASLGKVCEEPALTR
jgi:hypothetical protein